ncbi:hypothetical protein HPB47_001009 [Ixodes persulcatus]|uniref:Uncharacterized protein n=1 Tax=Ixodes persulcatus TaxID=34615 RepID=A0AC60PRR5_IXOPE|nr:hypothetical protein HPB47_001009 [Ixodes persulcatus]
MSTLRPEFKILAAHMIGRTTTALITFHGTHIPHEISYAGGIFRCRPHRPKAQYCHRCQQIGHRIDVCTYNARCPKCGQLKPDDDSHTCSADPVCLRCGGPHRADDAACKDKQAADAAVRQLAYNKHIAQRKAALKAEGVAAAASAIAPPKAPSRSRSRSRTRFTTPSRRRTSSSPRRTHTSSGRSPAGTRGHNLTAHQTPSRLPSHQLSQPLPHTPEHARRSPSLTYRDILSNQPSVRLHTPPPPSPHPSPANTSLPHPSPSPGVKRSRLCDQETSPSPAHTLSNADQYVGLSNRLGEYAQKFDAAISHLQQQITHQLSLLHEQQAIILATNEINPHIDTHLAHSWEARASLLKRWKRCKTNRKLRARIDRLNEHIQQYSDQLSSEHWHASCDELQNILNTAKTWRILKALINPDSTKTMTTHKINRLTNQQTDPDTLLAAIKELYATKIALGLPLTTSTARLVQLGVLPTVSDIIDIHRIHQRQRLSLTPTGRLILHELGYTPHPNGPQPTPLDNTILQHITVAPIPRHMDRDRNPTRRLLRAAYYTRKISRDPESHHVFTDAALKDTIGAFAYITSRGTAHSRTQRCASPVEAELLAIALAAANNSFPGHTTHIYTDSKSACSHLAQGLAFPSALPLLNNDHLLWDCPHNPAQPHTYTREWLALAVSLEQQRELAAHINRALSGCLD